MSRGTIWHVSSNRWNSAITEYALSATRALAARGFKSVFSPLLGSPAEERAKSIGLDVRPLATYGASGILEFSRMFSAVRPETVFVYGGQESFLLHLIRRADRTLRIRFSGNDNWSNKKKMLRLSKTFGLRFFDLVITPGHHLAAAMGPFYSCPVHAVPIGLDAAHFYPVADKEVREDRSRELVIFGRFDPIKGHEAFFRLYSRVVQHLGPGAPCLHVAGQPANISAAHLIHSAEACGLKLGTSFRLTVGRVDDVRQLMGRALAGVVPSLGSELICRVAEEYLLCGTPVIVSGAGSLGEVLFPSAGMNYRNNHSDETVRALSEFIRTAQVESAATRLARAATAKTLFGLERMGLALETILLGH